MRKRTLWILILILIVSTVISGCAPASQEGHTVIKKSIKDLSENDVIAIIEDGSVIWTARDLAADTITLNRYYPERETSTELIELHTGNAPGSGSALIHKDNTLYFFADDRTSEDEKYILYGVNLEDDKVKVCAVTEKFANTPNMEFTWGDYFIAPINTRYSADETIKRTYISCYNINTGEFSKMFEYTADMNKKTGKYIAACFSDEENLSLIVNRYDKKGNLERYLEQYDINGNIIADIPFSGRYFDSDYENDRINFFRVYGDTLSIDYSNMDNALMEGAVFEITDEKVNLLFSNEDMNNDPFFLPDADIKTPVFTTSNPEEPVILFNTETKKKENISVKLPEDAQITAVYQNKDSALFILHKKDSIAHRAAFIVKTEDLKDLTLGNEKTVFYKDSYSQQVENGAHPGGGIYK